MIRTFYLILGFISLGLGGVGIVVPLLPTVPFFILAAFCFTRSHPALERWLLEHPRYGRSIRLWREKGAISRRGKWAALTALTFSAGSSALLLPWPWSLMAVAPLLLVGTWIWRRPEM